MHAALPADAAHQALQAGGPHEVGTSTSNFDLDSLSAKTEVFSNFFDNDHKLISIPQPKQLINW